MDREQVTISEKRYRDLINKEEMYLSLIDAVLQSKEEVVAYEDTGIVDEENKYTLIAAELDEHVNKFKNYWGTNNYDY